MPVMVMIIVLMLIGMTLWIEVAAPRGRRASSTSSSCAAAAWMLMRRLSRATASQTASAESGQVQRAVRRRKWAPHRLKESGTKVLSGCWTYGEEESSTRTAPTENLLPHGVLGCVLSWNGMIVTELAFVRAATQVRRKLRRASRSQGALVVRRWSLTMAPLTIASMSERGRRC